MQPLLTVRKIPVSILRHNWWLYLVCVFFVSTIQAEKINNIIIEGNRYISTQTIRSRLPFIAGQSFNKQDTGTAIKLLYSLGFFKQIRIYSKSIASEEIDLIVSVDEKPRINNWTFTGSQIVSEIDIEKKLKLSEMTTLDELDAQTVCQFINDMYKEKQYLNAQVTSELQAHDDNSVDVIITVTPGSKTFVRRVFFKGTHNINEHVLRGLIFTREDWVLGFMDKSGTYHEDALEYDKYVIENYYQNHGYLTAQVVDVVVEDYPDNRAHDVQVTFVIEEGPQFRFNNITANGEHPEDVDIINRLLTIKEGDLYSKEKVRENMESIRLLWGERGHVYAQVDPVFSPPNLEDKTIDLDFVSTLGDKVRVRRIDIAGNKKTFDRVIRRLIRFNEGELLTTSALDMSKMALESTGFFEPRGGVNWKVVRINEQEADAQLHLKERRTGKINFQLGFGGSGMNITSPATGLNLGGTLQDVNAFGTGISYAFSGNFSMQDQSFNIDFMSPWIADRPIGLGGNMTLRRMSYDDFRFTNNRPVERVFAGSGLLRFVVPQAYYITVQSETGAQQLRYNRIIATYQSNLLAPENIAFQRVIDQLFVDGTLVFTSLALGQDYRNHPYAPSRGYQWNATSFFAIPFHQCDFGFAKLQLDGQVYIPLIDEYNLVLRLKGFLGYLKPIQNKKVPYKELFHIGGPSTVRGFDFGEIGPQMFGSSIGGSKSLTVSAELQFPISNDNGMRGVLFYDGGAGWDYPYASLGEPYVTNNEFDFRHAIGFGIRLTQPSPIRIDVGFRLDRRKRAGEPAMRIHFGMNQDFG